ncbi:MAG: S41 family peptidase [Usitatibacter sp.]
MTFQRAALGGALAALLAICAGCSVLDPHNLIGRQLGEASPSVSPFDPPGSQPKLGTGARERALDFVWKTIRDHYVDPALKGLDWNAVREKYRPLAIAAPDDEAFWDVLDRMTGELRDAHTRVESPKRVALRLRDEAVTLGFSFVKIGDRLIVSSVYPESDAWWAGVRPGMTLVSIAGEPAMSAYAKAMAETRNDSTERSRHFRVVRKIVAGEAGTKVALAFQRGDGSPLEVTLARGTLQFPPHGEHRVLPSGYGYIHFTQWTFSLGLRADEAVRKLKDTPGLIIDLRSNPGGNAESVNELLQRFFPHRTELGHVITRDGRPVSLFFGAVPIVRLNRVAEGESDAYTGPVVILMNAGSASASELFASAMQAVGRARIVGQQSCGCLLGFLGYAHIPGGGELAYSEVGFTTANGSRVEGEGVTPDLVVPLTLSDLQLGRDRPLEEAQALIATMKPWDR